MAKSKTTFFCQNCGAQHSKWMGQCSKCHAWNTIVEEVVSTTNTKTPWQNTSSSSPLKAAKAHRINTLQTDETQRYSTTDNELDRVLGGGVVPGSVTLVGGEPGIGKSTLMLQVALQLSMKCLYVSGEESEQQVKLRAERIGIKNEDCYLLTATKTQEIFQQIALTEPDFVIIDSVQTLHSELLDSAPGSVSQIRQCASEMIQFAKESTTPLILIGHITKDGQLAGPKILEHMVDTVLYFEGEADGRYRMLRAVKNRFGAVNELGVFAMTDKGLKEVANPSAIFLSRYDAPIPGSVVMATWEGSRPMLVEVQALVDTSHLGNPRRVTLGLDQNRLAMLLAVLHRHGGVATYDQDVFVNVVGGVKVLETAADLALLAAVMSSLRNRPLPMDLMVFGELGLSGEIRPVPSGQERLKEAAKHGFTRAIVPKANAPKEAPKGMQVIAVTRLDQALAAIFE